MMISYDIYDDIDGDIYDGNMMEIWKMMNSMMERIKI